MSIVQRKQIFRIALTGLVIGAMSASVAMSAHSQTGVPKTRRPRSRSWIRPRDVIPARSHRSRPALEVRARNRTWRRLSPFRTEMMSVQQKAATGDPAASARLSQSMVIMQRFEPSMMEATQRASTGDQNAAKRMGDIQFRMIHEWMSGGASGAGGKAVSMMRARRALATLALFVLGSAASAAGLCAQTPAPGWTLVVRIVPNPLPLGRCAIISIEVRDEEGYNRNELSNGQALDFHKFRYAADTTSFQWMNGDPITGYICARPSFPASDRGDSHHAGWAFGLGGSVELPPGTGLRGGQISSTGSHQNSRRAAVIGRAHAGAW